MKFILPSSTSSSSLVENVIGFFLEDLTEFFELVPVIFISKYINLNTEKIN